MNPSCAVQRMLLRPFRRVLEGVDRRLRYTWWRAQLQHLGEGSRILPQVVIHGPEKVSIGARSAIAEFVHMWGGEGLPLATTS